MFWTDKNKEPERFYLLPGMGGRAARRKQKIMLLWSILAGVVVSAVLVVVLYFINSRGWK